MRECIILAGGLGTRLAHLLPNVPKALAPINTKPFLAYLLDYLCAQEVEHFVFSLAYKNEIIVQYIQSHYPHLHISYSIENNALGTGGAIIYAMSNIQSDNFFVCNADTYFPINFNLLESFHIAQNSSFSIALKPMLNPNRYGTVNMEKNGKIFEFLEKREKDFGIINGGLYLINKKYLTELSLPEVFSLEKDFLESKVAKGKIHGQIQDVFFIDIGIPKDYDRAQILFADINNLKSRKALILDRDGVINYLRPNDYVKNVSEFKFKEDFLQNIANVVGYFDYLFIVTNQQGIGKALMKESDLSEIHQNMIVELLKLNVRIEKIYFCPHLESENCSCRKPNAGMIDQMKQEYPNINLSQSLFIGDSQTDLILANKRFIPFILLNNKQINLEGVHHLTSWDAINQYVNKEKQS